jgi:hypothetical protein
MHELTPAPLDSMQVTGPNMAAFWPDRETSKYVFFVSEKI